MTQLENDLFWEMERTIKLLGGKSDITRILAVIRSEMPSSEAVREALIQLKCWNDKVEKKVPETIENPIYRVLKEDITC